MIKNKHKIPCLCGHAMVNHVFRNLLGNYECRVWACECAVYKPDNLAYLENEYRKQNS